jgi:hypothetical protein
MISLFLDKGIKCILTCEFGFLSGCSNIASERPKESSSWYVGDVVIITERNVPSLLFASKLITQYVSGRRLDLSIQVGMAADKRLVD